MKLLKVTFCLMEGLGFRMIPYIYEAPQSDVLPCVTYFLCDEARTELYDGAKLFYLSGLQYGFLA